jgi:membrane dipeptidase
MTCWRWRINRSFGGPLTRRRALAGLASAAGLAVLGSRAAELNMPLSPEQRAAGVALLKRHPSVDTHAHPGRFFLKDLPYETPATRAFGAPFEAQAVADLHAGHVSASLFAAVADMRLLEQGPKGIRAVREFGPGEAYADTQRQVKVMQALVASRLVGPGLNAADIEAAHRHRRCAAVFAVEGGDFLEDKLERVHEAFHAGIRAITLVHYHINQIGDIQTEPPVHNGLTPLGASIVREMNRAGIIIDLAHAPFAVVKDAVETSHKPVMISHTYLATPASSHPRLISEEHAKLVASAGGIIGAWPTGFGLSNFADYIDAIQRLVDTVGVEHVAIGTDMDANYKPVLTNYRDFGLIPAALLARGLRESEVARIIGGNFLRVFKANLA